YSSLLSSSILFFFSHVSKITIVLFVEMFVNNEVTSNETNLSEGSISIFSNFSINCVANTTFEIKI
ncbi:hypothetical protein L9F63_027195, partial [Diploptera punctata]